jgi:hypothetical protein
MENITPGLVMSVVLSVASAVVLLSNAAEKIAGAWRKFKAPDMKQNERLAALEAWKSGELKTWQDGVDRRLDNDFKHLQKVDEANKVTSIALIALLDHGIAGNNVEQMQSAKAALAEHLTSK